MPTKYDADGNPIDERGLGSKIWDTVTAPTTNIPSTIANKLSNIIDPQRGDSGLRSVSSAFIESLGQVGDAMTSPLDLGLGILTGGSSLAAKQGLTGVARGLRTASGVASLPVMAHGANSVIDPNSTMGERGIGLLEMAGGGLGARYGFSDLPSRLPVKPGDNPKPVVQSLADEWEPPSIIRDPLRENYDTATPPTSVAPKFGLKKDPLVEGDTVPKKYNADGEVGLPDPTRYNIDGEVIPDPEVGRIPIEPTETGNNNPPPPKVPKGDGSGKPPKEPKEPVHKPEDDPSLLRQTWDLTRGLMSVDMPFATSAAFRQAAPLAGTKNWFRAFADNAKAFTSEGAFDKVDKGIQSNPIHQIRETTVGGQPKRMSIADEIGLRMSDLKTLSSREEQIRSGLAERIPQYGRYIRASNRSYTAFLNSVRTSTAEQWLKAANLIDADGQITNLKEATKIGNTINELTGIASLKIDQPFSRFTGSDKHFNLEKVADELSAVFFSPRNLVRDARMMNPLNYMKTDKLVRTEYLKGAIRRAGVWASLSGLGAILGAKINTDPTNSDFGKSKIKNSRLDPGTGLLQWIVLMAREATGKSTSSSSGRKTELGSTAVAPTMGSLAGDFLTNRLHPSLSLITNAMSSSEQRPFYPGSEVAERVLPMPAGDIIELAKSDPEINQILLGLIGSATASGMQTYGKSDFSKPTHKIPLDPRFEGGGLKEVFGR